MSTLHLPLAPAEQSGPVKAWREPIVIPTYAPAPAEHHPMFLDRRVYQGSTGKVYPLPFVGRIAEQKSDVAWDAVHIENEYLRVMILPALGGRIHVARDKTNDYDFVYRQDVIKPALVGLAGPWASGGIEFNWPQHHRPGTFMPSDVEIEREPDGSVTVWCGEHEPMNRMSSAHGVRLRPGRSTLELRVRLYNRTELTQTFLWWANVATEVNEHYQSFFPPDVRHVADHAKRATSTFPRCSDRYYGVDYGGRARDGVPPHERPSQFVPPAGRYSPDDLSWYANIPVPTSYMITGTRVDFFGGYDHAARAGIVHVASHHVSPGKKQWTWGNHDFGYAWDRNLTDPDERGVYRPYIELMAGVFTDNQPDFSFLAPGETRTFTQCWYPIRDIGPAVEASEDVAASLAIEGGVAHVGIAATARFDGARVELCDERKTYATASVDLAPDRPAMLDFAVPAVARIRLVVRAADGQTLLSYRPTDESPDEAAPATEPPLPSDVKSIEDLYLTGLHLSQYRHATRKPERYWREALRREPGDSRCNTAMGDWHLRRGEFAEAEAHLRRAIATLTRRNPNPRNGEAFYLLGVTLQHLGDENAAYDAFYKSTWNSAWQSPAFFALAQIACRRQEWSKALELADRCLRVNVDHLQARDVKAIVLRKLGRSEEAHAIVAESLAMNPVAHGSRDLAGLPATFDTQVRLDLAWERWRGGLADEAIALLEAADRDDRSGAAPLVAYTLAAFREWGGDSTGAAAARRVAAAARWQYCFPARLDEIGVLRAAIDADATDARAAFYLGCLLYDRQRQAEAIEMWERSVASNPEFAPAWRNLGIGYFNVRGDAAAALHAYDRAVAADPEDGRLLYERDQLSKRTGVTPRDRLAALESRPDLVGERDDLTIELASLYNSVGRSADAERLLASRRFQPWEGGEGLALGEHKRTQLKLGAAALARGDARQAINHFEQALQSPENLGEARHLLANASDVHYWLGVAFDAAGESARSQAHHERSASARGDFQSMAVQMYSEMTYYTARSLAALGRGGEAHALLERLRAHAETLAAAPAKVDYFATSLPDLLLFDDDIDARQREHAAFLAAQAKLGLGDVESASADLRSILAANPSHANAGDLLAKVSGAK